MTATVQDFIELFDHTAEEDKRECAAEFLRRTAGMEIGAIGDEALTEIADALFAELDREE